MPRRPRTGGARPAPTPPLGVALRLSIQRQGLGLELDSPVTLGCLRVSQLATTLPGVRFPVDVSGGVARFRHRRGSVRRLEMEIEARTLERWLSPRWAGIVSERAPDVWIRVESGKAVVAVASTQSAEGGDDLGPILAFDVHALADGEDLLLVAAHARGSELPKPATALATACLVVALGDHATRTGTIFRIPRLARVIAAAVFPEGGARTPDTSAVVCTVLDARQDSWFLQLEPDRAPAAPREEALRAREVAAALSRADDALVGGELDRARDGYFDVLERSPRQPDAVLRIVEIDVRNGSRAEAAIGMLAEVPVRLWDGLLAGELRAQVGDRGGALAALERAAERESTPALAARAYEVAARHAPIDLAGEYLDRAISRHPRAPSARWARMRMRLALGRIDEAFADVEHLEALAAHSRAKCAVWLRAGQAWLASGLSDVAAPVFERALRYVPDDAHALAGLGAALAAGANRARGVSLLVRALDVARGRGLSTAAFELEVARAFAELLDDLPAAIAHVAGIDREAPEALLARGLEGRWRAKLGDLVGASLAFARLRDMAGSLQETPPGEPDKADPSYRRLAELLMEGAEVELSGGRTDALSAHRYVATALRLRPHDEDILLMYRDLCARVADRRGSGAPTPSADPSPMRPVASVERKAPTGAPQEGSVASPLASAKGPAVAADAALASFDVGEKCGTDDSDGFREARVEELTRRLHAEPANDAIADELSGLLESLDRGHELLALLIGRLEDAMPDRRRVLVPRVREALDRLATAAESAGRDDEASLYRTVRDGLNT
ncbi:MAG: hypothetical protein ABSC94_15000 [Polyangiaceae bacterium]